MKTAKLNTNKILLFWKDKKTEWIQYSKLRDSIRVLLEETNKKIMRKYVKEVSERTIMRYLDGLVKSGKLEKRIDPDHHTFYRPKDLKALSQEVLKAWIDFQDSPVLDLLHSFTLELSLNLEEKKRTGEPLDLLPVFEKTTETVLGELKAAKTIQDVVGKLKRKE